ncbi:MAG TPA: sulfotransferase [Steroidobacteraceae bacterium]|nr:sulfotransferase [Steroidobacteraceae bacterium]
MRIAALLESDPGAALRGALRLLGEHPGNREAILLLATARGRTGDPQAASEALRALVAAEPRSAVLHLELGRALLAQGDTTQALTAFTSAVRLEPHLAEAWRELSGVHAARGESGDCDAAYARFTELAQPESHLAEAAAALAQERFADTESLLKRELARAPQDVAALRLLAEVAAAREDYPLAEQLLGECLRLAPGYARARFELARVLHEQQKAEPMLPLLERLLAQDPGNMRYRILQAAAYGLLGRTDRATELLTAVLADFPDNEAVWLAYGHAQRAAGRLGEAIVGYRRCLELRPGFGEAWFSLANLKTYRFTTAEVAAMRGQLAREDLHGGDRLHFEFALGKALEDAGEFAESFTHYARGNARRRAAVRYDPHRISSLVQRSRDLYTPEFMAARAGCGSPAADPIFVVGLPRSGSTLIEQILASHSQVEGTRELTDVVGFALELSARSEKTAPPAYPRAVASLSCEQLTALGERYLAQTRPYRLLGRPRFIDKAPINFLHIGLIHLMLPNARIIDARRAPLACCFANFKQHFQKGVWFTYSLEDLGQFYRDYVALMAHFDAVLPGRVHRVQYEDLVGDLEGEVRRLLDYCGLPFEERCLRFYETRRVVQTASSEQVRQPLYPEGVDQWRNYEPWLGPLKEALGELAGPRHAGGSSPARR